MEHLKQSTKTTFALMFGLLLLTGAYAVAQAQEADPAPEEGDLSAMQGMEDCPMMQGMMGGGMQQMHERMMEEPRMRSTVQVHVLPALEDSLSLDEEQIARLEDEKQQLVERQEALWQEREAKQEQLQEALAAEEPNLGEVETLLSERATLEAEEEMALYRTVAQMRSVLSDEQRAQLAELDPQEMHRAMTAHLSMQDMMRMMQGMQGECPMMNGMGMMGGMGGMMESCPMMQGMEDDSIRGEDTMEGMEDCPMMQNQGGSEDYRPGEEAGTP